MKDIEVIEPLTETEAAELARCESVISASREHVDNWIASVRTIRDGRLYRVEFATFADYVQAKLTLKLRAVHLALQVDDVRAKVQHAAQGSDQQIQAIAASASDRAIAEVAKVPKAKRLKVLQEAASETGGKLTGSAVKKAAAKLNAIPEKRFARGGFSNYGDGAIDSAAYTTPPTDQGQEERELSEVDPAAAFGGDMEPADLLPITDAASAVARLEAIYDRDKEWFNMLPMKTPRQIVDRLIDGVRL